MITDIKYSWRWTMKYKAIYWIVLTPFIKSYLKKHFKRIDVKKISRNAKSKYKELIAKADDIGDDNPMVGNLHYSLIFLSFHLANKATVSKELLEDMMETIIKHPVILSLSKFDFNDGKVIDKMNKRMRENAKWAEENKEKYPETWEFNFYDEFKPGCAYYFTKCPISKFCKDNNLEEYTKLFCNLDYIRIELRNGRLIREHTIADGDDICDFWIVGDKSGIKENK